MESEDANLRIKLEDEKPTGLVVGDDSDDDVFERVMIAS